MLGNPFCLRRSQSSALCPVTPRWCRVCLVTDASTRTVFHNAPLDLHTFSRVHDVLNHLLTRPLPSRCPRKLNPRFVHHTLSYIAAYMLCPASNHPFGYLFFNALLLTLVDSVRLLRNPKAKLRKAPSQNLRGGQSELFLLICSSAKIGERESRLRTLMLGLVSGSCYRVIST